MRLKPITARITLDKQARHTDRLQLVLLQYVDKLLHGRARVDDILDYQNVLRMVMRRN